MNELVTINHNRPTHTNAIQSSNKVALKEPEAPRAGQPACIMVHCGIQGTLTRRKDRKLLGVRDASNKSEVHEVTSPKRTPRHEREPEYMMTPIVVVFRNLSPPAQSASPRDGSIRVASAGTVVGPRKKRG